MTAELLARPIAPEVARSGGVACHRVAKRFPDGTLALDDIEIDCPRGGITVLLGPSGCGKTTLLRTVAGLEEPTSGTVWIDDQDVTRVTPGHRDVAMVFQNHALYPDKTAGANLAFPLRMAHVPKAERKRRVAETARLLRIEHLLTRRPSQLSGGQRQRVGIGRALIRQPSVLLMDEPFSSLDAELRVAMRAEFLALQRRLDMTTIYVTHDQVEALSLADRLVVLRDGHIEQVGTPQDVFERPETQFVATFLGGMNLLPCRAQGGRLTLPGLAEPTQLPDRTANLAGDVMIGVRPEDLRPGTGSADQLTLDLATGIAELLGRERLVHGRLGSTPVRFRTHVDVPVEQRMTVHASATDLHVFDADGRRMDPRSRQ